MLGSVIQIVFTEITSADPTHKALAADRASIADFDRFLQTASDAALLVSVRTESERKTALDRVQDLMDAKAGTPAGEELSRLVDWVLEYDARQERREEIETLKKDIADLRNSMSEVLKLVNGVMDLTSRARGRLT